MRKAIFLVAAACTFGLAPFAGRLGMTLGALLLVALSVALAVAASGSLNALAVASGALGAFTSGVLSPVSGAAAGACLLGMVFAERTLRVRSRTARAVHVGAALVAGALAGTLGVAYASSSPAVRGVAVVVAAVLAALPLLVDAEDPVAHALETIASELKGVTSIALREGAELRRHTEEASLDRETAHGLGRTWRSLLRLAEARLRLERTSTRRRLNAPEAMGAADAVVKMVDQRIGDHVAALARAYTAVDTAHAAEAGLDDAALRSVDAVGETLEDVSRAIVEVRY